VLPLELIKSLEEIKELDIAAFKEVHASGNQVTSIRLNPAKNKFPIADEQPVPWCEHGYYLATRPSFTLNPIFHAGAFYVQEASSMFLWHILKQTISGPNFSGLKVLDLCAAPGGKSTLLASYFSNALIVSNEVIKSRASILVENITKWGSNNVIVTNNNPVHFKELEHFFDVILIDAPCSGSGLFRKDVDAISEWSEKNVQLCSERQEKIIADIFPCLKENGLLIYSTCSYSKEENEVIIDKLVCEYQFQSIPIPVNKEWNIVETVSDKEAAYGYRFYPHSLQGEGFFIAALRKQSGATIGNYSTQKLIRPSKLEQQNAEGFLNVNKPYYFFKQGDAIKLLETAFVSNLEIIAKHLYIKKAGIEIGIAKGKDIIPHHELAVSTLPLTHFHSVELTKEDALLFLKRKDFTIDSKQGWTLITHCGLPLGWAKVLPNRLNNYYPTAWRILKD
jgi:16S rRNA C967 or C1407 C5-methylase (RsmB/RsmF family)/NOL1/NOP2/fmu family ribosome biogenesis protein